MTLTPDVGVSTHVEDLEELLWFEDLADVHLVLHSYAGVLAGPVAERCGPRLASVVYLGRLRHRPRSEPARRRATGDGGALPAAGRRGG